MNPYLTRTTVDPFELAAHNSGVLIARHTYAADEAVRAGWCASCMTRRPDRPRYRRCKTCRTNNP